MSYIRPILENECGIPYLHILCSDHIKILRVVMYQKYLSTQKIIIRKCSTCPEECFSLTRLDLIGQSCVVLRETFVQLGKSLRGGVTTPKKSKNSIMQKKIFKREKSIFTV